jgi:hypothetical protein
MDNQSSIARSSLSSGPGANLGHDFIQVIGSVKANILWKQFYHMQPSPAGDDCQHAFRGLNRVTRTIEWRFSCGKLIAFMLRIEMKPGFIQPHNVMPTAFRLRLKDPEQRSGVRDPTVLLHLRQEMRDLAKIAECQAKKRS